MLKSIKFGGTSMGASSIDYSINAILSDSSRRLISVSAPVGDERVTQMLIGAGSSYMSTNIYPADLADRIKKEFTNTAIKKRVYGSFLNPLFEELDAAIQSYDSDPSQYMARVKPMGEIIQAELFAEILRGEGLDALCARPSKVGLITNSDFENAKPLDETYSNLPANLGDFIQRGAYLVFPGFHGADGEGRIATFGFGGTDFTGAIVAAAFKADAYEIAKDVDGVLVADPRIVPGAATQAEMNYDEMEALGFAGADVVMYEAIAPLVERNIPLVIWNVQNPQGKKTTIANNGTEYRGITGIASKKAWVLDIKRRGIKNEIGFGRRLLEIIENDGISYDYNFDASSEINVVVYQPSSRDEGAKKEMHQKMQNIRLKIADDQSLKPEKVELYERGVVCVVAEGLRTHYNINMLEKALADAKVPIWRRDQGSDRSMIFIVEQPDINRAVRALYDVSPHV